MIILYTDFEIVDVNTCISINFYRAIIESILTSNILVWFGRASKNDINKLESVIRNPERIIGTSLPSLISLYEERTIKRVDCIMNDASHPASGHFEFLPSGKGLRTFKGSKRLTNSFYPPAVKLFNARQTR